MSEARCIDCGAVTERRLPARFPHICTDCLFPSQAKSAVLLSDLFARLPRHIRTTSSNEGKSQ